MTRKRRRRPPSTGSNTLNLQGWRPLGTAVPHAATNVWNFANRRLSEKEWTIPARGEGGRNEVESQLTSGWGRAGRASRGCVRTGQGQSRRAAAGRWRGGRDLQAEDRVRLR